MLWSIIVVLALPGISIRIAETERLGAGLAFGDILAFTRQHLSSVIVVSIVYIIAAFVVSIVGGVIGVLLCGIGLFVTVPLATLITYLIQAHLYAQVGRDAPGFAVEPVAATAISPAPEPAPVTEVAPVITPEAPAAAVQPDDAPPAIEGQ